MTEVTTFAEAHAALRKYYQVPLNGPYTLDRMYRLLAAVGNPQDTLRAIHIAGTSGKTSTAYYAAALLQQTGAKVGLTVSPHVDEVNERVQLNLTPLPEAQFCAELTEFLALVEASDITPSYFECMIAFAYWEFARQQVDYAVVEVGLGGLLDGTNTIQRDDKVCVIADIGFDHTEVLGDTLEAIAAQKAGIIQPHNAVFVHPQDEAVMAVFQEACHAKVAELTVVPDTLPFDSLYLPSFQRRNLSLALAAVKYVLQRDGRNPLDDGQIETAARTHIPARMETVKSGGRTFILDGAHNAQKLATLFDDVERRFPGQEIAALVGFVEGDQQRFMGAMDVVAARAHHLIATSFYSEKDFPKHSVPLEIVKDYARLNDYYIEEIPDPVAALGALQQRSEPVLIVCGSFYLMNHIRPLLLEKAV